MKVRGTEILWHSAVRLAVSSGIFTCDMAVYYLTSAASVLNAFSSVSVLAPSIMAIPIFMLFSVGS